MKRALFATLIVAGWAALCAAQTAPSGAAANPLKAFADRHCAGCHNEKLKSGGMSLAKLDWNRPGRDAEQLEKVVRRVKAGMMPPAGIPRPDAAAARTFVSQIENGIDQAAAASPNPGRPPLHRLNRTEYANAVRELLSVEVDVASLLPPDDKSRGFDNMADVLTMSPALMDGYIRAAGKISRAAVGDLGALAITSTYQIPRVTSQMRHVEGAPFGTRGGIAVNHNFPADGEYVFKLGFYYTPTGPLFGLNQGKGQQIEVSVDGERVAVMDIDPSWKLANDGFKTPPVRIQAGPRMVAAAFLQKFDGPVQDEYRLVEQSLVDVSVGAVPGMTTLPHLHELSIIGPSKAEGLSETPSRRKIFTCQPSPGSDPIPCAKQIVAPLARQAFRRPVKDSDLETMLGFFQRGRNEGGFEAGVRTVIQALLASPEFVFRFERVPPQAAPGANYRIGDLELASRLSFFLWSGPPDAALLSAAAEGRLRGAALEKEVRRMLSDPRASNLATNFAGQWLRLQNLRDFSPDLYLYPNFDRTLSASMRRETELLVETVMREDRSVAEFLTADYTFVDERLAKHYGIPNILGSRFRRVPVSGENRRGLLGHGSVLTLTSLANRTSPVLRGKYVMEVLLGTPPPPPPPNVPPLRESAEGGKRLSVRERTEEHRKNPACAACHQLMDPIGFALENFDVLGNWRIHDGGFRVDPSGRMYDGSKLDGPASLRQAIVRHQESFLGTFAENLLAFGLGRVLESYDMPAVRGVLRDAARNGNRFSAFVAGVVNSAPFQMKRAEAAETAGADAGRGVRQPDRAF